MNATTALAQTDILQCELFYKKLSCRR